MAPQGDALSEPALTLRQELLRKALHLSASVFPVAYYLGVDREPLLKLLALVTIVAVLVEAARRGNKSAGAAFDRLFGPLTRPTERHSITGATILAFSCMAAVGLLSKNAAIASLWCATVGDPAATIAGRLWRSLRPGNLGAANKKTLVGSAACTAVSFAGVSMLAGYAFIPAILISASAAAAEAIPSKLDDNFRVAGAAGITAQILA